MSNDQPAEPPAPLPIPPPNPQTSRWFSGQIFLTFVWIMSGISIIYGIRMYKDAAIDPSFIPIVGAAFAAALAFTIVIALEYATGQIKFSLGTHVQFEGASGPIILWCMCFFAIVVGLYLLGLPDVLKLKPEHTPISIGELVSGDQKATKPPTIQEPKAPTPPNNPATK